MGCSPSKGKLFLKSEGPGPEKALLAEPSEDSVHSRPAEEVNLCLRTKMEDNELPLPTEEYSTKYTAGCQLASDTSVQNILDKKEAVVSVTAQEIVSEVMQTDKRKGKKNKGNNGNNETLKRPSILQKKVDFLPPMVRAHQAAYAFLNPNISKYETLLGLLDQAAQTQLSLQPMISALVFRFEEINQALEEMAEEGELMWKEHGDYMAMPSGMMTAPVISFKPGTYAANSPVPPPNILQQLLHHSTEKVRLVGGSVQALGDTTLEEAAEYFSSLSKLMVEKLQAKQDAEQRLTHVLAQVEVAAMGKSHPEDSTLHSEDSGIGGENESLPESDRHRQHSFHGSVSRQVAQNKDDEENGEDDRLKRKRSNSSPSNLSQPLPYMHTKKMQVGQPAVTQPMTAISFNKPEHSTICVNIVMELQKSQRVLDQRMKKMAEIQGKRLLVEPPYNLYRAGLRRYSLSTSAGEEKVSSTIMKSPCYLPMLAPQPPKHHSVRRLINTFSQGTDGSPGQSLANVPSHIRRNRKLGIVQLTGTVKSNDRCLVINGNNNNNSWPDDREDLDVDDLPPPPPEVLLDNSFQSNESIPSNVEGLLGDLVQSPPMINQKTGVSQRLKASVQNVEVLPNQASLRHKLTSVLSAQPFMKDAVISAQDEEQQPENDLDAAMEKSNYFYEQSCMIKHLYNAAESPDKINIAELSGQGPSPHHATMGQRCESKEFYEGEMFSCSLPVTAPPVSRVRLPPYCPSVHHRFPSPPVFRPLTTSKLSSRPSSPKTVTHTNDSNTKKIIPSVSFHDARLVFCQSESQNSQTCLSLESSRLPIPWREVSRGRIPTREKNNSMRRTQSEQRPNMTSHSKFYEDGSSAPGQENGSEPDSTKYRRCSCTYRSGPG
ncbi:uncharacterized protein pcare2 [Paralichthys olivaceus]|uniref:uncharacterized protein pcare2 n=1 Tax=Paralichthys olivaceus TaxID=8255 RepID=UPI0037526911